MDGFCLQQCQKILTSPTTPLDKHGGGGGGGGDDGAAVAVVVLSLAWLSLSSYRRPSLLC